MLQVEMGGLRMISLFLVGIMSFYCIASVDLFWAHESHANNYAVLHDIFLLIHDRVSSRFAKCMGESKSPFFSGPVDV